MNILTQAINETNETNETNDNVKKIIFDATKKSHKSHKSQTNKNIESKEKKKRIITTSKKWKFTESDLSLENQANFIQSLETSDPGSFSLFLQQISQKIYNYKIQDIEKGLFSSDQFVNQAFVLKKLQNEPICFYCQRPVFIFYEYVREPKQWTLERIDNSRGHNCDNVEIACLTCNLRRRTMHYERFLFTKQTKFIKT
jgi:hypothetical protein